MPHGSVSAVEIDRKLNQDFRRGLKDFTWKPGEFARPCWTSFCPDCISNLARRTLRNLSSVFFLTQAQPCWFPAAPNWKPLQVRENALHSSPMPQCGLQPPALQ